MIARFILSLDPRRNYCVVNAVFCTGDMYQSPNDYVDDGCIAKLIDLEATDHLESLLQILDVIAEQTDAIQLQDALADVFMAGVRTGQAQFGIVDTSQTHTTA